MKLRGITVSGFRGFGREYDFDLSADVVLIHGPNGSGKTSLFDSILWALTGSIERNGIGTDVVSRYSEFGEGRVEARLETATGETVRVVRRCQSGAKTSSLSLEIGADRFSGGSAETRLMEVLWPDGASSSDPAGSLTRSLTRAVYLQQDQVRSFIEDESENSRFDIVGEIVGTGRVGELVRQLELGRKAWTTATNRERERLLQPLLRRRTSLRASVEAARSQAQSDQPLDERLTSWVGDVAAFVQPDGSEPAARDVHVSQQLNGMLSLLQSAIQRAELDLASLNRLLTRTGEVPDPVDGREAAKAQLVAADALVVRCEAELRHANERAAALRQQMVELTETRDSLAALARLALGHIDGNCPVCGQQHDERLTASRLNEMIAHAESPLVAPASGVVEAAEALRSAETDRAQTQASLSRLDRLELDRTNMLDEIARAAKLLHLDGPLADLPKTCRARIAALQARIEQASNLRRDGESLVVARARATESERAIELEAELPSLEDEIAKLESRLALREAAGDDAKRLHEALTTLSENLVTSELKIIEPLLQRIYASVDPHPSFRAVRFLTDTVRARGTLRTTLQDYGNSLTDVDPAVVLSSSQLNVLAVVTFMAMNLSATALPLELAALDDPLQSLDNVNLLGLADLLRRARNERQLIVSTHDDRLAGLLERKLRPVGDAQRTTVLRFDGWEPHGPTVTIHEVASDDPVPRLRAVS